MSRRRRIKRHERQLARQQERPVRAPHSTESTNSQLQTEDAWRAVWAAELSSRK